MFKVTDYKQLSATEFEMWVDAPRIAAKAQPGQFVIVQLNETAERIPFTICESDPETNKIRLIFQVVGKSTYDLSKIKAGDELLSVAGPLGKPTEVKKYGTVLLVGGGVGIAVLHPIVKSLKLAGNRVITILGAKTKDLMILQDDCAKYSDELIVMTDDGSLGRKGLVTDAMQDVLEREKVDCSWATGPGIMMRFCTQMASKYNVPTYVSLNPIMIDGTGMCGGCRVSVDDKIKFACVDGPEFIGSEVDWDSFMQRTKQYHTEEAEAYQEVRQG